jgi:hypothetical protein
MLQLYAVYDAGYAKVDNVTVEARRRKRSKGRAGGKGRECLWQEMAWRYKPTGRRAKTEHGNAGRRSVQA